MTSQNPLVVNLLSIPAWLYGAAVRIRNRLYDRPGAAERVGIPVVSVGNVTVGGTGKTPIVGWLVRRLQERGHRPAIVSRGYWGKAGEGPLVVSSGEGPQVEAEICGDEPYLLATQLPRAIVVVGSNRVAGCRKAAELGADLVVLDDGFQHRRLARDLDVVLLDAHSPFGNYHLLPAGLLREPVSGLRRADLIVITRSRPGENFMVLERVIRRHNTEAPVLRAGHRRAGFVDSHGRQAPRPNRAVAFCGIGNPAAFITDLEAEGLEVVTWRTFRDHLNYTVEQWRELSEIALREEAILVTTEKDMVRLPGAALDEDGHPPLVALRIEPVIHDEQVLLDRVEALL
jgi:tetraacyldisaccharide 4'-kinase